MKEEDFYKVLESSSVEDMLYYLNAISNEDVYINKRLKGFELEYIETLIHYKVIFIASDKRLFLTDVGNLLFQKLLFERR